MIEEAKAVAQRLREVASKGVSVWGDLQNEGASTIDALVKALETAHRAMDVYDDEMDRLRAEVERLHNEVKAMECDDVGELRVALEAARNAAFTEGVRAGNLEEEVKRLKDVLQAQTDAYAAMGGVERLKQEQAEPVAIAEGRDLFWIAGKEPADEDKDQFLFTAPQVRTAPWSQNCGTGHCSCVECVAPLSPFHAGLLKQALAALEAFKLPEDSIVGAQVGNLILRVPLETVQLQAAAYTAIRKHLGEA